MEEVQDVMVLRGDPDITNEVRHIDYENLKQTVSDPNASPPLPSISLLNVLSLSLSFDTIASKHTQSLQDHLSSTSATSPLPISFNYARENSKTPHVLFISSPAPDSPRLIEFSALDTSSQLAQKWVTIHSPPPLTKSGVKFKNAKSQAALRARERGAKIQVPLVGGGGSLDALVILGNAPGSGVKLRAEMKVEEDATLFKIKLKVYLDPTLFFPLPFSRSKQLLINRLFPHSALMNSTPEEATIDYFYSSLQRAPRTVQGLPLSSDPIATEETEEERATRLRREAKGKGRAIEPNGGREDQEGAEDLLIRPRGLKVELFPFQSRSVRWMVAREGARLRAPNEEEENEMDETEEKERKEKLERRRKAALAKEAKKGKGKGKGKGKAKKQNESSESSASEEEEEDEEHQRLVLESLSTEELARIKRGPLWEEVEMNTIEHDGDEQKITIFLNRITGQLSQLDPSQQSTTGNKDEPMKEEDEEEQIGDAMEVDENGEKQPLEGARVVGGIEGHGLLADEVGTGKTVTTISLILLHTDRQRRQLPSYFNSHTNANVQPTGLSLIVCPTAISGQWMQELARLAPSLRVLRYEAAKNLKTHFTPAYVAKNYDVVLTTFDVLRKEVTIARKPHVRALRNQAKREARYRRSLLIELDWLRVIADETQMVGDSFGPTSETLSLIPRQYSWAVTSTPLRDKIDDIRPLLTYLRVEPIASTKSSLARLLEEPACFKRLFNEIGERTLKSQIENELVLPKQTRFLVPLDFTAVEKFYYDTRYNEMLEALGLNHDGAPREQIDRLTGEPREWSPDKAEMNKWLNMLRALAAHPQIGAAGRQALGHVLKTVEEVYATMREKAVSEIQSDQKAILAVKVKRGQYGMWDKDVEDRFEPALRLFENVLAEVEPIINEVTHEIHENWKERKKSRSHSSASPVASDVAGALQVGFANDEGQDEEILSAQERAFARSLSSLRNRLRELLFVKHSALFFSGHAHFNMKQEDEETKAYSKAEQLRQTLLQPYEDSVQKAQSTLLAILEARDEDHVLEVTDLELPFNEEGHGIVALTVYEDIEITSDILNGYAELIYQYRQMIIDMMLKTVSIAGDNATGEEYEERAILQEKLEIYIEAYTVLVGEWSYGITGTRTTMADQFKAEQTGLFFTEEAMIPRPVEPAPPQQRKGKKRNARKAQLDSEDEEGSSDVEIVEDESEDDGTQKKKRKRKPPGEKTRHQQARTTNIKANSINDFRAPSLETGHTPADILRYELLVERIEAMGEDREFSEITPLRHLIKKLKDAAELSRDAEIALLDAERSRIGKALGPLEAVSDRLKAELGAFGQCFNVRLSYFKNLQGISDSVKDPDMESSRWRGLLIELEDLRLQENDLVTELEARKKRKRYLDNLNTPEEEQETCPICAEHYNDGVLLGCVHLICRKCFKNWHARSQTCPLCKARVADRSWTNVKYRRKGKNAARTVDQGNSVEGPEKSDNFEPLEELGEFELPTPELAQLSQAEIDEISSIETAAPLSTKSDFIVKHVKLLRRREPEAKIVIFSAWQDALSLLAESFNRNGLEFVRLEGSQARGKREGVVKRFTEDPSIAAFFLHTKSQSAGLNLLCARYMMLVEPLLAPQLEVQATARIWRIGQTKETVVFNYAISDSVDFRVAELRARAGTSLFLADYDSNAGRESMLGQTKDLASNRSRTKETVEALEDEDEIARCLLSTEHYAELQRSLLPFRLRNNRIPLPGVPGAEEEDIDDRHEMEAPGFAAAGRAVAREEAGEE